MLAQFQVCTCGKHGRIVLASGYRGPEVCEKEWGLHLVRTGAEFERLTDDEATTVMQQILESHLPSNADQVERLFLFSTEVFNQISVENEATQQWSLEIIHELLHGTLKEGDIPADFLVVIKERIAAARPH